MEKPNLVYTVALDPPRASGARTLAKMLASSLLRTFFTGEIIVFRNTSAPLFPVERQGLDEIFIDAGTHTDAFDRTSDAWCWKYRAGSLIDPSRYNKIMYIDADSLALRNIDHLFEGIWDIAYQNEPGFDVSLQQFSTFLTDAELSARHGIPGVNAGTFTVRADLYKDVMTEWERIDTSEPVREVHCRDQGAWNKLLLDTTRKISAFPAGEIQFPLCHTPNYKNYKSAALVHNLDADIVTKIQFTFGLYTSTFYCDPSALVLDFLEM